MHIEDATSFIVDFIARPRADAAYSDYGYDVYMPNVVAAYLADIEKIPRHIVRDHPRGRELTLIFLRRRMGALPPGSASTWRAQQRERG